MNFFIKNVSILIFLMSGQTLAAQTRDRYWPEEVLSVERTGPLIKVTYLESCGSEYFGTILRPSSSDNRLLVGVLSSRADARCTGMAKQQILYLRTIEPKFELAPLSFSQSANARAEITPFPLVSHHVRVSGNERVAELAFVKTCKTPDYLLLQENGTSVSLGLLDIKLTKSKSNQKCGPEKMVATKVPFLKVDKISAIARLDINKKPHENASSYGVKLARVKKLRIERRAVKASYFRRCNEIGIGIVLGPKRARQRIGVVVTRFGSVKCKNEKRILSHITIENLALSQHHRYAAFRSAGKNKLLTVESARVSKKSVSAFELEYVRSCERPLGAVFTNDNFGHVSTGILLEKTLGRTCHAPFHEETMRVNSSLFIKKYQLYPLTVAPSLPDSFRKVAGDSPLLPGWTKS